MDKREELYAARDKNGWVGIFKDVPFRDLEREVWTSRGTCLCFLNKNWFPELNWEDDPIPIDIVRKEKNR